MFTFPSTSCALSIRGLALGALALGALASCGRPPEPNLRPAQEFFGTVTIFNATHEMHTISIAPISSQVSLDCDVIASDPQALLSDELFVGDAFSATFTVPLFSGEELAVDPAEWTQNWIGGGSAFNTCNAFLVTSPTLRDMVVFYDTNQWPMKTYFHNADAPKDLTPSNQTIVLEADYSLVDQDEEQHAWREHTCPLPIGNNDWWNPVEFEWDQCFDLSQEELNEASRIPQGTRYSWRSVNDGVPLHFERALVDMGSSIRIPARCRMPNAGESLFWEDFTFSSALDLRIRDIEQGRDGCHTVVFYDGLNEDDGDREWLLCAPYAALAPLLETPEASYSVFGDPSGENLTIDVRRNPDIATIELFRGGVPSTFGLRWDYEVRSGCAPIEEGECGEASLPIDLRLRGADNQLAVPGEVTELSYGELHVVRAVYSPIINRNCETSEGFRSGDFDSEFAPYVEGVIVLK